MNVFASSCFRERAWNSLDSGCESICRLFAETYKEKETVSICQRSRESTWASDIPLLVAVHMYQMPLANQVKALPRAHFIFTPLNPDDLDGRLEMMTGEQSPTTDA